MQDVIFFLKETPKGSALAWPRPVKLIGLDPGPYRSGGSDPLTSTAYANLYASLRDANGQVIPNLLRKHKIADPGRVAFVGFSAAHGFLSPMLDNDADRRLVDSVILMDACFGSGKRGYQKALVDAAAGRMMLVIVSSTIPGTPLSKADVLHSGTLCVEQYIVAPTGLRPSSVAVRAPLPEPLGGSWQFGSLGFWLRLANDAGQTNAPHYELGKYTLPMMQAYLLPRFRGELGGWPWWMWGIGGAAAVLGGYWLWDRYRRR